MSPRIREPSYSVFAERKRNYTEEFAERLKQFMQESRRRRSEAINELRFSLSKDQDGPFSISPHRRRRSLSGPPEPSLTSPQTHTNTTGFNATSFFTSEQLGIMFTNYSRPDFTYTNSHALRSRRSLFEIDQQGEQHTHMPDFLKNFTDSIKLRHLSENNNTLPSHVSPLPGLGLRGGGGMEELSEGQDQVAWKTQFEEANEYYRHRAPVSSSSSDEGVRDSWNGDEMDDFTSGRGRSGEEKEFDRQAMFEAGVKGVDEVDEFLRRDMFWERRNPFGKHRRGDDKGLDDDVSEADLDEDGEMLNKTEASLKDTADKSRRRTHIQARTHEDHLETQQQQHADDVEMAVDVQALIESLSKAQQGDADAQLAVGLAYFHGRGTPPDARHAEEWLVKSAEQGNARAAFNLGTLYKKGGGNVQVNETRATGWFGLAAQWGHVPSQYVYAVAVLSGKGVVRDEDVALEWFRRAAEGGHSGAQLKLGLICMEKVEGGQEAVAWLRRAADQGEGRALFELGSRMLEGIYPFAATMGPEQEQEGLRYLQTAAEVGSPPAQYLYGDAMISGLYGLAEDEAEGADWIIKAAEAGVAVAQCRLGAMEMQGYMRKLGRDAAAVLDGSAGIGSIMQVRDPSAGFKWMRKAAGQGFTLAQYIIGSIYASGEGLPRDEPGADGGKKANLRRAARWLRAAANKNHPEANWELAELLRRTGSGVASKKLRRRTLVETDKRVLRAAKLGVSQAMLEAGRMMKRGIRMPKNLVGAAKWFRRAAERGVPEAQYEYACALLSGKGVAQDVVAGCEYLEKAARGEHVEASFELGARHVGNALETGVFHRNQKTGKNPENQGMENQEMDPDEGRVVERRPRVRWDAMVGTFHLRRAARWGHTEAMLVLGRCYRDGKGVATKNNTLACYWLEHAAHNGHSAAQLEAGVALLAEKQPEDIHRGLQFLQEAVRLGVQGAAAELEKAKNKFGGSKFGGSEFGGNEQDGGKSSLKKSLPHSPFASAHLDEMHELHNMSGRLRISILRAEGLPLVASKDTWGSRERDMEFVPPSASVVARFSGEGMERPDVRWMSVFRRPKGSRVLYTKKNVLRDLEDTREFPLEGHSVRTRVKAFKTSPRWKAADFSVYLNGSTGVWREPLNLYLYTNVGARVGSVLMGSAKIYPWEVPLRRREEMWVKLDMCEGFHFRFSQPAQECRVLLKLKRSTARLPGIFMQTEAQKALGAVYKWDLQQTTHVDIRERREEAKQYADAEPDDIFDPTLVETADGRCVPYEMLKLYKNPNMYEPILADHTNPKYLKIWHGHFGKQVARDVWTVLGKDGWEVPDREALKRKEKRDDWYGWLKRYTGGRLTREDVPPGSLSPFLSANQIRMVIKKMVLEKEKKKAVQEERDKKVQTKESKIVERAIIRKVEAETKCYAPLKKEHKYEKDSGGRADVRFSQLGVIPGGFVRNLHTASLQDVLGGR